MCCIELAMTVYGIVILVNGRIGLPGGKAVRGGPAYAVGGLLLATLPVAFVMGFFIGFMTQIRRGVAPDPMSLVLVDILLVAAFGAIALTIALANAKEERPRSTTWGHAGTAAGDFTPQPPPELPPPDPDNPYASPYTDPNEPPRR